MSFLFASSHLPAVWSTRPELEEEEEEENVNPESLPRSGGVRASSHLEERGPESARRADGSPATRRADAASDWLGRLKEQLDPQRGRAAPAAPDEHPRRADAEREPDAEHDHDADEAPGTKSEEAPENENTRSWYLPPESSAYDPDPGFHIPPQDIAPASQDHGFDPHLPEGEESSIRDAWGAGADPSSQDWGVRRSDEGQDQPPGDQRSVGPAVPQSSAPASGRSGAFPNSRLFEVRPHPALTGKPVASSSPAQRAQGIHNQGRSNLQGLFSNTQGAPAAQYSAQAKTGLQQSGADKSTQNQKGQKAAPLPGSTKTGGQSPGNPPLQKPQASGSLAKYRQQRQKLLDALNAGKKPSQQEARKIQKQIASITRNMESIELAAHLINHTKQKGETDIDPESIDENSAEFKSRARTAIHRLHGGSAPWMDHLAENFGEREKTQDGSANSSLVSALGIDPTAAAWCGTAMGKAMGKAKIAPPGNAAWAGNWRKWGKESGPNARGINVGDVYHIRYKDGTGHVATVVGISKDGTQVYCLGGNQNDGLNISAYPIGSFTDPSNPGRYKDATIVFKRPADQANNTPAPTFDYNADSSTFDILAGLTR